MIVPDRQVVTPQGVPGGCSEQAPVAEHVPTRWQLEARSAGQSSSGSVPARMSPHVPLLPDPFFTALQVWQLPAHAVSQQNPSTQKPLEHTRQPALRQSAPAAASHVAPVTLRGAQVPPGAQ